MKVAIVGSRNYQDLNRVTRYVASLPADTIVVSGGARGVDHEAECAARQRGLAVLIFPANWNAYGKSAGYRRNAQIVAVADYVVAFWDGVSKGTLHSMKLAEQQGKRVIVNPEVH